MGQEKQHGITHQLLEVMCDYPPELLVVQTRSPLVTRDIELLERLGDRVVVAMTIPTNREDVRQAFEFRSPRIANRISALAELRASGIRTQASLAPLLPCDTDALAGIVAPHCDWVVAQALKLPGHGARTWEPALATLKERGWEGWVQGGVDVQAALETLRAYFGARYHEGREGFNLEWKDGGAPAAS